jgi:hypothetical protein
VDLELMVEIKNYLDNLAKAQSRGIKGNQLVNVAMLSISKREYKPN